MVRKSTILLAASMLAAMIVGPAWSQAGGGKAAALLQLTQSPKAQLSSRTSVIAAANPKETAELGLDLIFYRWACHLSGTQTDVKNIDAIISALTKELNDQTISWAVAYFTVKQDVTALVPPARDDERVPALSELNSQFRSSVTDKESSSVDAVNALGNALKFCHSLSLELSEALVQKQLGDHYLYNMALYREAKTYYDYACWSFTRYGCTASEATVYDDLGTLSALSGATEAVENYKQAAQQWESLAKADPSGYKYRDLVGREYMRAGSAAQARDWSAAHELMTQYGLVELRMWAHLSKSYDSLIQNLIEVARLDRDHGLKSEALGLLEEAKTACNVQGDPILSARVYDEFSKTYTGPSQTAKRFEVIRQRDRILKAAAGNGEAAVGKIDNPNLPAGSKNGLYKKIEWGAKSYTELKNYARAAAIWKKMADVYSRAGQTDEQIRVMRSLAAMLDVQGKTHDSLEARRSAAAIAIATNRKTLAAEIAHEIVKSSVDANDVPNALEAFTEWGNIVDQSGNTRGVARVFEERAELLVKNQQIEGAIADYGKARARYLLVSDPWAAGAISLKLAAAQRTIGKTPDSLATLESALDDIENKYGQDNMRAEPGGDRARVLIGIYHDLISLYVIGGAPQKADYLVSKAKPYQWAADLVSQLKASPDRAVAIYANQIELISIIPPTTAVQPASVKTLGDDVFGFWEACTTLENSHQSSYRALPIDPKALLKSRHSIPRDSLVVEYMTSETGTDIFVCGFDKTICREINLTRDAVGKNVTKLRKILKNCEDSLGAGIPLPQIADWQESSFLQIKEPLVGLYGQLVAPIAKDLGDRTRLIFVLPGELAGMPMHALISSGGDKTPRFMLQDYEISYLAKDMLDDLINKDNRMIVSSEDRLAIFADPERNLPGAYSEARNIRGVYMNADRWYLWESATASNFLKECATANIVHIAAHHTIDPTPGGFSLTLARDDKSDGKVGMRDLLGVYNPALRLVVLSACDAVGSSDPISLGPAMAAEAFSMMGAKSVLGGLWKVSDEVASSIMGDFYRNLAHGAQSRTRALRGAQLNVITDKQFAHPFYWACFALYGNPR